MRQRSLEPAYGYIALQLSLSFSLSLSLSLSIFSLSSSSGCALKIVKGNIVEILMILLFFFFNITNTQFSTCFWVISAVFDVLNYFFFVSIFLSALSTPLNPRDIFMSLRKRIGSMEFCPNLVQSCPSPKSFSFSPFAAQAGK